MPVDGFEIPLGIVWDTAWSLTWIGEIRREAFKTSLRFLPGATEWMRVSSPGCGASEEKQD